MKVESAKEIGRLMINFGSSAANTDPEVIRTMTELADQYPTSVVRRVVSRFISGDVEGQSFDFAPKPPQFAQALKREHFTPEEQEAIRQRIRREVGPRQAIEAPQTITHSEDSKARVARLLEQFKRPERQSA